MNDYDFEDFLLNDKCIQSSEYPSNGSGNTLKRILQTDIKDTEEFTRFFFPFRNHYRPAIKSLNEVTELLEKDNRDHKNYFMRAGYFEDLFDPRNSTSNYCLAASLNPKSGEYFSQLSQSALISNDIEISLTASDTAILLRTPSYLSKAILMWKSCRYDDSIQFFDSAIMNGEKDAFYFRSKLFFCLGRIRDSLHDILLSPNPSSSIVFVLKLLSGPMIPSVPDGSTWDATSMRYLRDGIFKSFKESVNRIPIDMWIPRSVQAYWATYGNQEISVAETHISDDYPEGFAIGFSEQQKLQIQNLFKMSELYGKLMSPREPSKRSVLLIGSSFIEVIDSMNKGEVFLNDMVSIIVNWLRLINPLHPMFYRHHIPGSRCVFYIQKSGVYSDLVVFQPKILTYLKKKLSDGTNNDFSNRIQAVQTTEELWELFQTDICIEYQNSAFEIFIQKNINSPISFGINISNTKTHWKEVLPKVFSAWSASVSKGALPVHAFQFLYYWMKACPITTNSQIIGCVLFSSLFAKITGFIFDTPLPPPLFILFEALLANDFPSFLNSIKTSFKTKLVEFHKEFDVFPSEVLPNLMVRIQAAVDII